MMTPRGQSSSAETSYTPDSWHRPYSLMMGPTRSDLLVVSYGSDGMIGGKQSRADWVYELSMLTNGAAVVRILDSPVPESSRDLLIDRFTLIQKSTGFPADYRVELPGSESLQRLDAYQWRERRGHSGLRAWVKYCLVGYGPVLGLAAIFAAMGWFWFLAVFNEQTAYLVLVVVLAFPFFLLCYILDIQGESTTFLGILGFVTVMIKADRSEASPKRSSRAYLFFFFALIVLSILFGMII